MRVLLVYANPYFQPLLSPYGLECLEAPLRENHSVKIITPYIFSDPEAHIQHVLEEFMPEVVGINLRNLDTCVPEVDLQTPEPLLRSVFFPELVREGIKIIKAHMKRKDRVFLGGTAFSVMPGALLDYFSLRYGVTGRGEFVFPAILEKLVRGDSFLEIPGLVYRNQEGRVTRNPEQPFTFSGLTRPFPQRHPFHRFSYHIRGIPIHTKVGCDQNCIYCVEPGIEGRKYIYREPADVVEEIGDILERDPSISTFFFTDCEMNLPDGEHMMEICSEIIKSPAGGKIFWTTHLNPSPLTGQMTARMAEAGCNSVVLTIDSASDRVLKKSGKDFLGKDVLRAFDACRRAGLKITADLIFGMPGEDGDSVHETIAMIRANPDVMFEYGIGARIYPGTALSRLAGKCSPEFLYGDLENKFFRPAFYSSPWSPVAFQGKLGKIFKDLANVPKAVHSFPTSEERRIAYITSHGAYHAISGEKREVLKYYRDHLETGNMDLSLLECLTAIYGKREDFEFLVALYEMMLPRMLKAEALPLLVRIVFHRNLASFYSALGQEKKAGNQVKIARFLDKPE